MAAWNLVGVRQRARTNMPLPLPRVTSKYLLSRKPQKLVAVKEFSTESIMSAI
jgi:hypothetical protein